jgi:sugar phosphate isomerase/epimerase
MPGLKIGALVDSLRLGVRRGIEKIAELGLDGFQVYVTGGELAPEQMTRSARREFRKFVADRGLVISALCVELGGYTDEATLDERIGRTQRMIDLGVDLGVPIHSAHIGRIPDDPAAPTRRILAGALLAIGSYAAERECCLACETGPEDTALMHDFIASLATDGVKVNFDPANLVMKGFDPVRGVYELADFIVHTHAKDGIRNDDGSRREVPVGQGAVPWDRYVGALRKIGYEGFYTIERESGEDPVADVAAAHRFLARM